MKGEYEAQEENMKRYLAKAKALIEFFQDFNIQQVSRAENAKADAPSRLVSILPFDLRKDSYIEVLK